MMLYLGKLGSSRRSDSHAAGAKAPLVTAVLATLAYGCAPEPGANEASADAATTAEEASAETRPRADAAAQEGLPALTAWSYTCGDDMRVVTTLDDERMIVFLPERTVTLPRVRSASSAKYEGDEVMFWTRGTEATLEIADGETFNCAENRAESIVEDAKLRGMDFFAVGNEPPWRLELGGGRSVIYTGYDHTAAGFDTPAYVLDPENRRSTLDGQTDDGAAIRIVLQIEQGGCQDSMSGQSFETTVRVELGGRTLQGCGMALH